jgi:hypothetical protein
MQVSAEVLYGIHPVVEDPDPSRAALATTFLWDLDGQEDLYLGELAKAEAGETVLDLYNQHIDAQLYPDGRVLLEELRYSEKDEQERGPPARTELTLAEAKQLILDWLEAKRRFYAEPGTPEVKPPPPPTSS